MMQSRPMAFMRGLTFPGGQQPVIQGREVYLRYPRIGDYVNWSALRGESREFLTQWEPVWAEDELSRGAFRRRIKRYHKETSVSTPPMCFSSSAKSDDTLMGGCTLSNVRRGVTQCCALGYWIGTSLRPPGRDVRRVARPDPLCLYAPWVCTASRRPACRRMIRPAICFRKLGFRVEGLKPSAIC